MVTDKYCSSCKQYKPVEEFYKNKRTADGLNNYCKSCKKRCDHNWYASHPRTDEQKKENGLRAHYKIGSSEYDKMLGAQGGMCAICKQPETVIDKRTKKVRRLEVDHCHRTGKIRGLLCRKCNTALGILERHGKEGLQSLLRYLETFAQEI